VFQQPGSGVSRGSRYVAGLSSTVAWRPDQREQPTTVTTAARTCPGRSTRRTSERHAEWGPAGPLGGGPTDEPALDAEELLVAMRQPTVREQIAAVLDPTALLGLPEIVYRRAHSESTQETAARLRAEVLAEADRLAAWLAAHDEQVRAQALRDAADAWAAGAAYDWGSAAKWLRARADQEDPRPPRNG
jgi:hypothetical protein